MNRQSATGARRAGAVLFDWSLAVFAVSVAYEVVGVIGAVAVLALIVPFEATCVRFLAGTLGQRVAGIRLHTAAAGRPSARQAVTRVVTRPLRCLGWTQVDAGLSAVATRRTRGVQLVATVSVGAVAVAVLVAGTSGGWLADWGIAVCWFVLGGGVWLLVDIALRPEIELQELVPPLQRGLPDQIVAEGPLPIED